jgi:hypothetical protein
MAIFTTNKALTASGCVLHDDDLAHAILDRVLERGRLLTLDGPSMRTKHLGLDDATAPGPSDQAARISGTDAPEFPEPTKGYSGPNGSQPLVQPRRILPPADDVDPQPTLTSAVRDWNGAIDQRGCSHAA